jgi:hypothetical protein
MITGYNTEVSYSGIIYHVQTEDMGVEMKKIITHVYKGGAILLSKKTAYDHLVAGGAEEDKIKALMNDQHKTILRIIQAGKLETLRKKVEEADKQETLRPGVETESAAQVAGMAEMDEEIQESVRAIEQEIDGSLNTLIQKFIQKEAKPKKLKVEVVAGTEIVSGQPAVLRVYTRDASTVQPLPDTKVVIKVIGMTFRPAVYTGRTDKNGVYTLNIIVPEFSAGQAAILVQASSEFGTDELKLKISRRI